VAIAFLAGTIIQGLIVLNDSTYVYARWHGTLLVIAITAFSIFFNTFLANKLPMVEALIITKLVWLHMAEYSIAMRRIKENVELSVS
jgi:hypothetical protein